MTKPASTPVTQLLIQAQSGDAAALDAMLPVVYEELRRVARGYLRSERTDHTLQPTALVHEVYMRLIDQHSVNWENRAHFFSIAAQMMRRVLLAHAETRNAQKRGGGVEKVTLSAAEDVAESTTDLVELDAALKRLEALDARQARIVELRYFGGLDLKETAAAMSLSVATIKREWATARLFLKRELSL